MNANCYCAVCKVQVSSPRFLLCGHCQREYPEDDPWILFLKREERNERKRVRLLRRDGIDIIPLSAVSEEEIAHGVKLA